MFLLKKIIKQLIEQWIPKYYFPIRGWILGGYFALLCLLKVTSSSPFYLWGLVWILIGWSIRGSASLYISQHSNGNSIQAPMLAHRGIYRYIRHPLYLGNLFIGIGTYFTAFPYLDYYLILLAFILHHIVLIFSENHFLKKNLGKSYQDYIKQTPFWFFPLYYSKHTIAKHAESKTIQASFRTFWDAQAQHILKTVVSLFILYLLSKDILY